MINICLSAENSIDVTALEWSVMHSTSDSDSTSHTRTVLSSLTEKMCVLHGPQSA